MVIEHLRGSTTGASVCREIELELQAIQQNTDQLDSGWKNMETTIKQSLQLNQYRDELKTMMNTLRELEEKRLRIIDFGNSRQSFETYENTFEQLDQRATVRFTYKFGGMNLLHLHSCLVHLCTYSRISL